jgi:hypothetical protein
MPPRLADKLTAARQRRFVGRASEQALFQSALAASELPFQLLYIFGPGGVGKTTLLNSLESACEQAKAPHVRIDARNVEPSPDAFVGALRLTLNLAPADPPLPDVLARSPRSVILVDTCENLAPLDAWLRDVFLPELPETTLTVMAGRNPPAPAWQADPGWQTLIRTIPLRNLSPDEGREYLLRRGVPAEQHAQVLSFTHSHPLALSLVADVLDQRPGQQFQPEDAPNVVKTLLEQFVQKVPGLAHRAALEACALVRLTTESLLAEMLVAPDAHELFDWLRSLSFIESGPLGLFPHDLAREALGADVRWRNPDWYAELHKRARGYYTARLAHTTGIEQQRHLFDLIFLHRDNPVVRPVFEWQASGSLLAEAARPEDETAVLAMTRAHEGDEAAHVAAHWLKRQPRGALVVRDADRQIAGWLMMVGLPQTNADDWAIDSGARLACAYLQKRAPLRPGETATLFRFWMARDTYQSVSPAQSLLFVSIVRHYLTTPGLAFTFIPCAEAEFWLPVFTYADLHRLAEADFEIGARRYGMYGHDWRVTPPGAWLALLAEREVGGGAPVAAPAVTQPIIVLSETEFADAVRDALRDFTRPDVLHINPLTRSRLVMERTANTNTDRASILQGLLREASEALQASPREAKLYRALHHTYLQPAPTQEQAAELLDIPFSTYRRHLKSGLTRVTEILWAQEVNG